MRVVVMSRIHGPDRAAALQLSARIRGRGAFDASGIAAL